MALNKIHQSKFLAISLIFSFILLITAEAFPKKVTLDSDKGFTPVVKVRQSQQEIPELQKKLFRQLIEDGKSLLQVEMNYEGAIKKFKEAHVIAITREQKADSLFYLSLAYFATIEEKGVEEFNATIRKLIEIDYYRKLDELSSPLKYMELFRGIKEEYGALRIQSKPAGADVYINDNIDSVGKTPVTVGAKAGTVRIIVKKGKQEKKDTLRVVAGETTTSPTYVLKGSSGLIYVIGGIVLAGGVGAALLGGGKGNGSGAPASSPTPTTGSIQVNSNPTGAQVFLDGNNTGRTTNTTLTDVSPGSHTIKLVKEGYYDHEESVSVTAGQTTTVNATLTEIIVSGDYAFITKWGSQGSGDGQFDNPHDIAIDREGYLYVTDSNNHRIQKFTSDGTFVSKWGSPESGDGQFDTPLRIATDNAGNLYITTGNNQVLKFTSDGAFLLGWGSEGSGDGQFSNVWGIARDGEGNVYVTDGPTNHRIQKFTSDGTFVRKWGGYGTGDSQFDWPQGIATDGAGFVYVADTDNSRIQKFTSDGTFATKWGTQGNGDGNFHIPRDLFLDEANYVYVADSMNHRIQKFTSTGTFITKWGTQGNGDGQFEEPRGIAVDSSGYVYVADMNNHRIQKFAPASAIQKGAKMTYSPLNNDSFYRNLKPKFNLLTSPFMKRLEIKQRLTIKKVRKNEKR